MVGSETTRARLATLRTALDKSAMMPAWLKQLRVDLFPPSSETLRLDASLEVLEFGDACDSTTATHVFDFIFQDMSSEEKLSVFTAVASLALSLAVETFLLYIAKRIHLDRTSNVATAVINTLVRDQASILPNFCQLKNLDIICPELASEVIIHFVKKPAPSKPHAEHVRFEMENVMIAWINALPLLLLPLKFQSVPGAKESAGSIVVLHFLKIAVVDGEAAKQTQRPSCGSLHHSILKALSTHASKTSTDRFLLTSARKERNAAAASNANSHSFQCTFGELGTWPERYIEQVKDAMQSTTGVGSIRLAQAIAVAHAHGFLSPESAQNGVSVLQSFSSDSEFVSTVATRLNAETEMK
eukprot:m.82411 g.82411  ORF g.82411 m.82411 type:complete len:357 (-) comp25514_c0_seq1:44-1114(-)